MLSFSKSCAFAFLIIIFNYYLISWNSFSNVEIGRKGNKYLLKSPVCQVAYKKQNIYYTQLYSALTG